MSCKMLSYELNYYRVCQLKSADCDKLSKNRGFGNVINWLWFCHGLDVILPLSCWSLSNGQYAMQFETCSLITEVVPMTRSIQTLNSSMRSPLNIMSYFSSISPRVLISEMVLAFSQPVLTRAFIFCYNSSSLVTSLIMSILEPVTGINLPFK